MSGPIRVSCQWLHMHSLFHVSISVWLSSFHFCNHLPIQSVFIQKGALYFYIPFKNVVTCFN